MAENVEGGTPGEHGILATRAIWFTQEAVLITGKIYHVIVKIRDFP